MNQCPLATSLRVLLLILKTLENVKYVKTSLQGAWPIQSKYRSMVITITWPAQVDVTTYRLFNTFSTSNGLVVFLSIGEIGMLLQLECCDSLHKLCSNWNVVLKFSNVVAVRLILI